MVIDRQIGDGAKPTVYLKPDKFTSVVMVLGYLGEQQDWSLGKVIDSRDEDVRSDYGLEEGDGIHEELPLFDGKVVLEN
jgi:hypothetical protein